MVIRKFTYDFEMISPFFKVILLMADSGRLHHEGRNDKSGASCAFILTLSEKRRG